MPPAAIRYLARYSYRAGRDLIGYGSLDLPRSQDGSKIEAEDRAMQMSSNRIRPVRF